MKIAEGLSLRKTHLNQMATLLSNLQTQAYDVGNEEELAKLFDKYLGVVATHQELVEAINYTNHITLIDGISLAAMKTRRDMLLACIPNMQRLPTRRSYANGTTERSNNLDLKKINEVIETYARLARELDNKLQQANWNTDLVFPRFVE